MAAGLREVSASGRFSNLRTVDIADIIAGRPEDEALEVQTPNNVLRGSFMIDLNRKRESGKRESGSEGNI